MTAHSTRVTLIGGFTAEIDGHWRQISRANDRIMRLLMALACRGPAGTSVDELVDVVWAGEPPGTAYAGLRKTVQRLRGLLGGHDTVLNTRGGYALNSEVVHRDVDDLIRLRARLRAADMFGAPTAAEEHELSSLLSDPVDIQTIELADPERVRQLKVVVSQIDEILSRTQNADLLSLGAEVRTRVIAALTNAP